MRQRQLRLRNLPSTLPDDVLHDQFDFEPTWEEKALEWNRQQMQAALAEVNRIELEEQREWLARQNERLAMIALEIDETERRQKLNEEMEKRENWWKEVSEREKEANERILAHFQDQLDGGVHADMVARANKAKADMDRDNARLERLALLKRGVLEGTRKQFAGGRVAHLELPLRFVHLISRYAPFSCGPRLQRILCVSKRYVTRTHHAVRPAGPVRISGATPLSSTNKDRITFHL